MPEFHILGQILPFPGISLHHVEAPGTPSLGRRFYSGLLEVLATTTPATTPA